MFLRVILAAVAALYFAITTLSSAQAGEPKITVLSTRTVPVILPEGVEGSDPCFSVRMRNPVTGKSGRGGTQICDRHILTGTVGETSASAISCQYTEKIIKSQLKMKAGETFASVLTELNTWINRSTEFDFDQKIEMFVDLGVKRQCLFTISHASAKSDEVQLLVIRTGTDDWILFDNVEETEGGIVAWRDVLRQNAKAEYGMVSAHDGKFWTITSR